MAEQVPDSDTETPLSAQLDVSNVLVYAPSFDADERTPCKDLLVHDEPAAQTLLAITYRQSPREWVADWIEEIGTDPTEGAVIGVGNRGQFGADETESKPDAWTLSEVENPGDLTGLGVELSEHLSGRYDTGQPGPALCFDSITHLLQYADLEAAFRLLHVVTGRIRNANARGHYHIDPEAHKQQEIATLMGLFDAVVEHTDDGWTVRRR